MRILNEELKNINSREYEFNKNVFKTKISLITFLLRATDYFEIEMEFLSTVALKNPAFKDFIFINKIILQIICGKLNIFITLSPYLPSKNTQREFTFISNS